MSTTPGSRQAQRTPQQALQLAREQLLCLQHDEGYWKGELQTNVTMDAEDLLLREFLGIRQPEQTARQARWIRSRQLPDGSWNIFYGGDGDLSATIEAYLALRLAGDSAQEQHMRRARRFIVSRGGVQRARVFTHIWLAIFGAWPWEQVPVLPPELMLLPPAVPLNIYDFACWARQTIAALTVVISARPCRPLPFSIEDLHGDEQWRPPEANNFIGRLLLAADRALHLYERMPIGPLRRLALARAERWILDRQEGDGGWGGIQPPLVYSLIALHLRGYEVDHPAMRAGLKAIDGFTIDDDQGRRMEACQSPVWDTALAVLALVQAGEEPDHPALVQAADWLLDQQVLGHGDWAVRRPQLPPGGWAFEFANVNYPDVDDTAEVVMALEAVRHPQADRVRRAVEAGVVWMVGMQSSDGGWGAFDADNTRAVVRDLPFCDFGEVIDPPSADVTAHIVEALALLGRYEEPALRRGIEWLLAHQEPDGSWFGRWGINHIYGTGAVLPALREAGVSREHLCVRRAVRWLEEHQNADGGWGEDPRSYADPVWVGRGTSTASQTAWALLALEAAGEANSLAARRGLEWLARAQLPDGTWDEPQFTGTGFPGDFYINYHLYRLVFPTMALGRLLR
jgi:squalene-hopene/tetraprenyl-beta-curcumene cyclase